jgi:hypothetical protein
MIAQIKSQLDYETQVDLFIKTLSEISDEYFWTEELGNIRGYNLDGQRFCPLSAIITSLYYQEIGVDAFSAGRFLGMSSHIVTKIVGAADGDWASTDTLELRDRIKDAVGLKSVD